MITMKQFRKMAPMGALCLLLAMPVIQEARAQDGQPAPAPAAQPARTPTPPNQPSRAQPSTSTPSTTNRPARSVRSSTPSTGSSSGRSEGKYVPPEFKIQADTDAAVLLIETESDRVQVGQIMRTDISLINPRSMSFSGVTVGLQYDPKVIEPIAVNTHHTDQLLSEKDAQVYSKQGIVYFRGKFSTELANVDLPLFTVRWKTLATSGFSTIKFVSLPGEPFGVLNADGKDILGSLETENDGLLSASFAVEDPTAPGANWRSPNVTKSGITLNAQYEILGDTFDIGTPIRVDVFMANPEKAPFNIVNVEMKFDPEYLEVLDWDKDNHIALATNVQDGLYKENFAFTYHITNRVINTTGDILYKMGTVSEKGIRVEPTPVFSILFQVRKPFSQTDLTFKMPSTVYEDGTRVTYLGNDVLGDSLQPGDGASDLTIFSR